MRVTSSAPASNARSTALLVSRLVVIHKTRTPEAPGPSAPARKARSISSPRFGSWPKMSKSTSPGLQRARSVPGSLTR